MQRLKGLTQEQITSFQDAKFQQDFVYQTNQSLQSLSQGLIGLSISFEKQRAMLSSEQKYLEIQLQKHEKRITESTESFCSEMGDKICETTELANEIHRKVDDIYDNYARLDDLASVQLDLEEKIEALEKAIKINAAYVDSSLMILKGQIQGQIDDLRRLINKPDLGHQQCEISLQIKKDEDAVTIAGLQKEIALLKKQCDYNQKQFEFVVNKIKSE